MNVAVTHTAAHRRERRPDRINAATRHYAAAVLRREGSAAAMQALVDGLLLSRAL